MIKTRPSGRALKPYKKCKPLHSTILLVGSLPILSTLDFFFVQSKCKVHHVETMEEAQNIIDKCPDIHLAICDLFLKDARYGEVLDCLYGNGRIIPSIAITDYYQDDYREFFLSKGVVDFISPEHPNLEQYIVDFSVRLISNHNTQVLIVDDSLTARVALRKVLTLLGFKVLQAKNGLEAIEILGGSAKIKMVVTDYNMPKMDGFALTEHIRKTWSASEIGIIGVSGVEDRFIASKFLRSGASDFITKPFSYEELLCRIHSTLENLELIETTKLAANCDFLTGLFNRRHFFELAYPLFDSAVEEERPIVAAVFDIDFFKKVNDTYGHDVGDVILKHCAHLLKDFFKEDVVSRFGGEEFIVLFYNKTLQDSIEKLNDFRAFLLKNTPETTAGSIPFTVSVGVVDRGPTIKNIDEMLHDSDEFLYKAKEHGRNRVVSRLDAF